MGSTLGRTRRRRPSAALGGATLALVFLVNCRGGDRADRTADTAFATPPDSAMNARDSALPVTVATPPVDTAAALARDTVALLLVAVDSAIGDSLYQNSRGRCLSCHGPRGAGSPSLGPSLRDSVWLDTDGSVKGIAAVIHDGVAVPRAGTARMPAFGNQLDSTAIHRLAVYVYSLSHVGVIARDSAVARAALSGAATPVAAPDTSVKH